MTVRIQILQSKDMTAWDTYVRSHPEATLYHLSAWSRIIQDTYGHEPFYLMAVKAETSTSNTHTETVNSDDIQERSTTVVGVLPMIHLKSILFGNKIISVPFFDMSGILADDADVEKTLLSEALRIARRVKADQLELRHLRPLTLSEDLQSTPFALKTHKVRMVLDLPGSSEALMKSFKSKLRSQIKKPLKAGLTATIGGTELLKDFYTVFVVNMRDLGSPVHSKKLMMNIFKWFHDQARIGMIWNGRQALAGSLFMGFNQVMENPWSSALRQYQHLSPNMLLYWTMLEYACENGFAQFDFGRSSPDEGTYKFKEQWGAVPQPLYWQLFSLRGRPFDIGSSEKSKFDRAIRYWRKIPVPITRIIGPVIRKHIGL